MNTLKLWRKLRNPPLQHPIFRYNTQKTGLSLFPRWMKWLAILAAVYVTLRFNIPGIVLSGLALGLLLPALFIVASGTVFGLRTAVDSSNRIVQMQENGTGELFTLSSQGTLGWRWLVGVGCLHRQQQFRELHDTIKLLLGLGGAAAVGMVLLMGRDVLLFRANGLFLDYDLRAFFILLTPLPLLAGLYIDHMQSIVLGVLMGINVPSIAQSRVEAHTLATLFYMLLQAAIYLFIGLIYLVVVPAVYNALQIEGTPAEFLRVLVTLVAMMLLREGLILVLWRATRYSAEQPYSIEMLPGLVARNNP